MFSIVCKTDDLVVCLLRDRLPNYWLWPGYYVRLNTKAKWYSLDVRNAMLSKAQRTKILDTLLEEAMHDYDTED